MLKIFGSLLVAGSLTLVLGGCTTDVEDSTPEAVEPATETVTEAASKQPICAIKCAAPPAGCHYENARTSGPCHKLTCGTLVCDGSTL